MQLSATIDIEQPLKIISRTSADHKMYVVLKIVLFKAPAVQNTCSLALI